MTEIEFAILICALREYADDKAPGLPSAGVASRLADALAKREPAVRNALAPYTGEAEAREVAAIGAALNGCV